MVKIFWPSSGQFIPQGKFDSSNAKEFRQREEQMFAFGLQLKEAETEEKMLSQLQSAP